MTSPLLDTNALVCLVADEPKHSTAVREIRAAQAAKSIYISPIPAWEAGLASQKQRNQPNLLGLPADEWFQVAIQATQARVLAITKTIALEAAIVPPICDYGDPGDCFLIATARVRKLAVMTRDNRILELAKRLPDYLQAIPC